MELCKVTIENTKLIANHLKTKEEELKDKTQVPIINKIANVIEKELASIEEEIKVTFLQVMVKIIIGWHSTATQECYRRQEWVLKLRQKTLFASHEGEEPLKYDADHIQQLFCRTVETGLQDNSISTKLCLNWSNPLVEDEELTHQRQFSAHESENWIRRTMRVTAWVLRY